MTSINSAQRSFWHRKSESVSYFTLDDRVLVWLIRQGQSPVYRDVPLLKSVTGAGLERSSAPEHFQKDGSSYSDASY